MERYQQAKIDREVKGCDKYEIDRVACTESEVNGTMHVDLWSLGLIVGDDRSTVRSVSVNGWSNRRKQRSNKAQPVVTNFNKDKTLEL